MKRKMLIVMMLLSAALLGGCEEKNSAPETAYITDATVSLEKDTEISPETVPVKNTIVDVEQSISELPDGIYTAAFITDSSMFHVNEACQGKGTLTVENGKMTIHISLATKNILNLYPGLAEDAAKEGAKLLLPTEDTVTYSDGMTEEVYGFDVPVPVLETEFDLALIGKKGKWYDHKVRVSNPVLSENTETAESVEVFEDGTYNMEITFEGGSGKANILSPVTVTLSDTKATATVQWNSPNYDYMLVDGKKYLPINMEGDSVFEIPVSVFDQPIDIIGDTVAMSKPHEVEYTITFHSDTMKKIYTDTRD